VAWRAKDADARHRRADAELEAAGEQLRANGDRDPFSIHDEGPLRGPSVATIAPRRVVDHVGGLHLDAAFTLDDAEAVMARLLSKLAPGTRRQVAQTMLRLLSLAVYGKWIRTSPIPRGWLPKPGADKAKKCLYPDEDRALLGCTATKECRCSVDSRMACCRVKECGLTSSRA
jgi:hypothetical protein